MEYRLDSDTALMKMMIEILAEIKDGISQNSQNSKRFWNDLMQTIGQKSNSIIDVVKEESSHINEGISSLSEQIKGISNQIGSYQNLLEQQIEMAASKDEVERIIQAYSDVVTKNITRAIDGKDAKEIYEEEKLKLIDVFCLEAWNKMDESSQSFLVSAKVIYKKLEALGDAVDYSGVCLLVTKALEVEIKNRFGIAYLQYIKKTYGSNYDEYPTGLLDRNKTKGSQKYPVGLNQITLGSFAYILCYHQSSDEKDKQKDKKRLLEFSRKFYLQKYDQEEAFNLLKQYAADIERIRTDYRNPTAHTGQLTKVKAMECMNLVVDVEKLLKKMLDSFSN